MKKKLISLMLVMVLVFTMVSPASAATKPSSVYSAVKSAVGSSNCPSTKVSRGFGAKSYVKKFVAYSKSANNGKEEYLIFIGYSSSNAKAKKAVKKVKSYISDINTSYLNKTGKAAIKNVKSGTSGKWSYVVMLKSSDLNDKAVKAIKKKI